MTKISPIAEYLTINKAITKRENRNIWHFFSPQGLYLGKQTKIEHGGVSIYIREVFGERLKRLFYESKTVGEQCAYYKEPKSKIGLGIIPVKSYVQSISVDYTTNKVHSVQIEKQLKNPMKLIAIECNTKAGVFEIPKPFVFSASKTLDRIENLKRRMRINHTVN